MYYGIRDGFDYKPAQVGPSSWEGIAQWFGLTAFLFCVHSMVYTGPLFSCLPVLFVGYSIAE